MFFWITAGLLAAAMFAAGMMKVMKSRDELKAMQMDWVEDYTDQQVKMIGMAEVVGAVGVIVPAATGILPILSPIAALCLGVLMAGAVQVHVRRKDPTPSLIASGAFVVLSLVVAAQGF